MSFKVCTKKVVGKEYDNLVLNYNYFSIMVSRDKLFFGSRCLIQLREPTDFAPIAQKSLEHQYDNQFLRDMIKY